MMKKYRKPMLWPVFFAVIFSPLLANSLYNYQNSHFTCWNKAYLHNRDITYDALTTYSVMGNSGQFNFLGQLSESGKKALYIEQPIPFFFTQDQDQSFMVFTPATIADSVKKLLEPMGRREKKWSMPIDTYREGRKMMVLESDGIPIYVCTRI
ncbi:hypothetical protein [Serratia sp. D1N4]